MATKIPITKEKFGLEENRSNIWDDMERDMESRRREWESEIDKMSTDFFSLRPETDRRFNTLSDKFGSIGMPERTSAAITGVRDEGKAVIEKDEQGNPVFRVRFDVSDYKPDEVNVKMDSNKMQVHARHEKKDGGKSVSREFSREINIPREIDPMSLQCAISKEGVLCVEAPYPTPQYSVTTGPTPTPAATISQNQYQSAPKYQSQPPTPTYQPPSYTPPSYQHAPQHPPPPPVGSSYQSTSPQPPLSVHQDRPIFQQQQHQQQPYQNVQAPPGAPFQTSGFQSQFPPSVGSPSRVPPSVGSPSRVTSVSTPIIINKESNFKVEIDIEDFAPEELTVKTLDKKVVVSGRREVKEANRSSTKELSREYNIPDTVDPITVKAFFTDGGRLIVEAPYKTNTNGGFH